MSDRPRCKTCAYYQPTLVFAKESDFGRCCLFPPQPMGDKWEFPEVREVDRCGFHDVEERFSQSMPNGPSHRTIDVG